MSRQPRVLPPGILQGRRARLAAALPAAALLARHSADAGAQGQFPDRDPFPQGFDFAQQSGALAPDRVVPSACPFCNSLCRLQVPVKGGSVIDVRGEPRDPVQSGGLCVKAQLMTQLLYNRHRLKTPLVRVRGRKGSARSQFEPVSWEQALQTIARRFLALRDSGQASPTALLRHQPGRDAPRDLRLPAARQGRARHAARRGRPAPHADRGARRRVDRPQAAHRP